MERLTQRVGNEIYVECGDKVDITEKGIIDLLKTKLAAYEDAEEQGRLLVLPCKVGDTVYIPIEKCHADFHYCPFEGGYGTARCDGDKNCKAYVKERGFSIRDYPDIGKTIFLTREEAEKALEGMNNG